MYNIQFGVIKAEEESYKPTKNIINVLIFSENIGVRTQCIVINWMFLF